MKSNLIQNYAYFWLRTPVEENHVRTMGRARQDLLAKDIGVCVLLNSRVRSAQMVRPLLLIT